LSASSQSLPAGPWHDAIDTLLREVLPAKWNWSQDSAAMKRAIEARGISPYKSAAAAFQQAIYALVTKRAGSHSKVARALQVDALGMRQEQRRIESTIQDLHISDNARTAALELALAFVPAGTTYRIAMAQFDRALAKTAIERAEGNHSKAARALGVHPNTVWNMVKRTEKKRRGSK
jgi:DNA-binding protein Fis